MKVLFLTNLPSPYRMNFFEELGKKCDLTVVFERCKANNRNEKWYGQEIKNYESIFLNSKSIGEENSISFSLIKILKKRKFNYIIIGGYSTYTAMLTIMYLRIRNIYYILNVDGGFIKKDNFFKYHLKKFFLSGAIAYLSPGKNVNKYLEYYGAPAEKCYIFPFSSLKKEDLLKSKINNEEKTMLKKELNVNEKKVILSIGQFIHRKGFDILMKACKDLDNSYGIYIIGGTPTQEYIEIKENLQLNNVHFMDFQDSNSIKKWYKISDLFVLATREDIWGLVINEAMNFGLPIITTNKCNAGLELIENGKNGFIVNDIENPKEYSQYMKYFLESDARCKLASEYNLKKIKRYTIENMANVVFNILNNLEERNDKND